MCSFTVSPKQMPTKSLAHNQFHLFISARFVFREGSAIFRENFSYVSLHRCNQILLYRILKDYEESNTRKVFFFLVLLTVLVSGLFFVRGVDL